MNAKKFSHVANFTGYMQVVARHFAELPKGLRILDLPAGSLPRSEALAAEVLSLPLYPELPEASVDRVAAELNALAG